MRKIKLQNLDCVHCSKSIEKSLNKMSEISNVRLNFSTSTLIFEQRVKEDIIDKIEKKIQKIEKKITIVKEDKKKIKFFGNYWIKSF